MKKKKEHSQSWYKKELDAWFSKYIRLKYDTGHCFTCGHVSDWKHLQCGHLVSRYYLATRFDERNCRPQCYTCNMFRNGMIPNFSENLEKQLGEGITKELYRLANTIVKDYPYKVDIEFYKAKVKELFKGIDQL